MKMNKSCLFLISALIVSSTFFSVSIIPSIQAQGPTPDLPMTIINETNSSNNTAIDAMDTHNVSQALTR